MALLWADGFDDYDANQLNAQANSAYKYPYLSGNPHWFYLTGRHGTGSFWAGRSEAGLAAQFIGRDFGSNESEVIFGAAVYNAITGGDSNPIFSLYDGTTRQVMVGFDATGNLLSVKRGDGTVLASVSNPFILGRWYILEAQFKIANSGGRAIIRFTDGITPTTLIDFTGDTQNTANAYATRWYAGNVGGPGGCSFAIDDLYVANTTGDDPTTFIGDGRAENIKPSGAGNSSQFTPSAGSNWQNVDDVGTDSDTTYNASSTVGHKDTFATENLLTTSGEVVGVILHEVWRKDDAGARTARQIIRSGGTDYEGPDVVMNDSYVTNSRSLRNNPNTSAQWTISEVNAVEVGYKVEA